MAGSPFATPRVARRAFCPCLPPPVRLCLAMYTGATVSIRSRTAPAFRLRAGDTCDPLERPGHVRPTLPPDRRAGPHRPPPPRLHDLRHRFACRRGALVSGEASMSNTTCPSGRPPSGRSRSARPLGICVPPRRGSAWPHHVGSRRPGADVMTTTIACPRVWEPCCTAAWDANRRPPPHHGQRPRHLLPAGALGPATRHPSAFSLDAGRSGAPVIGSFLAYLATRAPVPAPVAARVRLAASHACFTCGRQAPSHRGVIPRVLANPASA